MMAAAEKMKMMMLRRSMDEILSVNPSCAAEEIARTSQLLAA